MAQKTISVLDEIKKGIVDKKIVLGTQRTLKELLKGSLARVFISSNCSDYVREKLKYLCGTVSVEVFEIPNSSEELGVMAKKPFLISVLSFKK